MKTTESKGGIWGQRPSAAVDNARSQSFPAGGLVDLARAGYQSAPLTVTEFCPEVFAIAEAGGTVTAVRGPRGCAFIDTGYGPRVDEIRRVIADRLEQSPVWLIDTHELPIYDGDLELERGLPVGARALQKLVSEHDPGSQRQQAGSFGWNSPGRNGTRSLVEAARVRRTRKGHPLQLQTREIL
jgi:hypothetical protein